MTAKARRGTEILRSTNSLGGSSSAIRLKRAPAETGPEALKMLTAAPSSPAVNGASGCVGGGGVRHPVEISTANRTRIRRTTFNVSQEQVRKRRQQSPEWMP